MTDLTREALIEATAQTLDENWNPDRYPVMAAMFRDYAATAVDEALRFVADDLDREADAVDRIPPYIYDRMQTEIVAATYRDAAERIRSLLPSTEGDRP